VTFTSSGGGTGRLGQVNPRLLTTGTCAFEPLAVAAGVPKPRYAMPNPSARGTDPSFVAVREEIRHLAVKRV
jgi:hypothetical protein